MSSPRAPELRKHLERGRGQIFPGNRNLQCHSGPGHGLGRAVRNRIGRAFAIVNLNVPFVAPSRFSGRLDGDPPRRGETGGAREEALPPGQSECRDRAPVGRRCGEPVTVIPVKAREG